MSNNDRIIDLQQVSELNDQPTNNNIEMLSLDEGNMSYFNRSEEDYGVLQELSDFHGLTDVDQSKQSSFYSYTSGSLIEENVAMLTRFEEQAIAAAGTKNWFNSIAMQNQQTDGILTLGTSQYVAYDGRILEFEEAESIFSKFINTTSEEM